MCIPEKRKIKIGKQETKENSWKKRKRVLKRNERVY
jgi:hypothetical protein